MLFNMPSSLVKMLECSGEPPRLQVQQDEVQEELETAARRSIWGSETSSQLQPTVDGLHFRLVTVRQTDGLQ